MSTLDPTNPPGRPPIYKQVLVGLMVGAMLGPLVGWSIGTFATFFTSALMDSGTRGVRTSAFVGGLIGMPLGLIIGVMVATPIRIVSSILFGDKLQPWLTATLGALLGFASGYLIHQFWNPSDVAFVYLTILSVIVGAMTGTVASVAKPKWL